jgi:hypothetical protein
MLILISPAKTLDFDSPPPVARVTKPQWIDRSKQIMGRLRQFSPRKLGGLMQISPALAEPAVTRYRDWHGAEDAGGKQAFALHGYVYEGLRAVCLIGPRFASPGTLFASGRDCTGFYARSTGSGRIAWRWAHGLASRAGLAPGSLLESDCDLGSCSIE